MGIMLWGWLELMRQSNASSLLFLWGGPWLTWHNITWQGEEAWNCDISKWTGGLKRSHWILKGGDKNNPFLNLVPSLAKTSIRISVLRHKQTCKMLPLMSFGPYWHAPHTRSQTCKSSWSYWSDLARTGQIPLHSLSSCSIWLKDCAFFLQQSPTARGRSCPGWVDCWWGLGPPGSK